ncbi:glutathione S-transferase domain protein [Cucurbitaria berberidis CBS 394.84]|uniref:Glutathione S-transferase domain protein n=1 Tax=Cucurbitaria berberidis CBS 394.84 TaxID=1168544 RepID=A0A9P4GHD4_9PLEO|nr:glutathione S-transferase domain protein [Cucurbitaria berberidis CBS 394.84]KAF1846163.1 glutathione S-transferase domain protein [Cucurbitaria berberidis CBS 394.84]
MHLYDSTIPSGNAYKIQLLLSHLKIPYKTTSLNIVSIPSESRSAEFLVLNPNGRIPTIVLDDGTVLAESNAIMFYLAEGTKYLPDDKLERARVFQWLFFEQYSHEPYVAVCKFRTYWAPGGFDDLTEREIKKLRERGQDAIDVMEIHLSGREWFVGDDYSIADIALYVYTSAAEAIGFRVEGHVRAWLERVEKVEGWVKIKKDPTGKCPS